MAHLGSFYGGGTFGNLDGNITGGTGQGWTLTKTSGTGSSGSTSSGSSGWDSLTHGLTVAGQVAQIGMGIGTGIYNLATGHGGSTTGGSYVGGTGSGGMGWTSPYLPPQPVPQQTPQQPYPQQQYPMQQPPVTPYPYPGYGPAKGADLQPWYTKWQTWAIIFAGVAVVGTGSYLLIRTEHKG